MKTIACLTLLFSLLLFSCASTPAPARTDAPTSPAAQGDGLSFETAVKITADNEGAGVAAEYEWLGAHYPGCKMIRQALATHEGKPFDILTIAAKTGEEMRIYFDISDFFGKW
jgi:hypothetical protein